MGTARLPEFDPSESAPRSELRIRTRPHTQPGRENELIVEVVRAGVVVGTIYGSREGVHIMSDSLGGVLGFEIEGGSPGLMIVLLRPDEPCPWCGGAGRITEGPCPLCHQ